MAKLNKSKLFCSYRLTVICVAFFGYCILYVQRVNMGIAILCMVNNTALSLQNQNNMTHFNSSLEISNESFNSTEPTNVEETCQTYASDPTAAPDGEFIWPKKLQGLILVSFFYGYFPSIMLGGYLTSKFGGVLMTSICIGLSSLGTLLLPVAARWNLAALLTCRVLTGFAQGFFFPSIGSLWVTWIPLDERSSLLGFVISGIFLGTAISLPIGGYLCSTVGWSPIFYSNGAVGIIWVIIFALMVSNHPKDNRFVSNHEKNYIMQQTDSIRSSAPPKTPWLKILTSKIVLAISLCMIAYNWVNYLYLTQIPTYIKEVLKMDIKSNGLFSALPYVLITIVSITGGIFADFLSNKKIMKKVNVRRVYTIVGLLGASFSLIGLSFVKCNNAIIGIALLTIGFSFGGLPLCAGASVNIYEIGGPFTSILLGYITAVGNLSGLIAPYAISAMTTNKTQGEWQTVFWVSAGLCGIASIPYLILADVTLQKWAKVPNSKMNIASVELNEGRLSLDDQEAAVSLLKK